MVISILIVDDHSMLRYRLPGRNAQQNFFGYQLKFLMNPLGRNHPRTESNFQSC